MTISQQKPPQKQSIDRLCLIAMSALIVIGVVMIFSTSSVIGFASYSDSYYFIRKHLFYLCLGVFAFSVGLKIPYFWYKTIALPGIVGTILLLFLTLIPPFGVMGGGAYRWLDIGLIVFQPIEVGKFFILVFVSTAMANKYSQLTSLTKGVFPILLLTIIPLGLLSLQPDLGNMILILGVIGMMLFVSPLRWRYLIAMGLSCIAAVTISVLKNPYQLDRIKTFLSPWSDPLGRNYHIIQSFIAIGSGGLWGLGLGQSKLKYYYLPLHYSDFIFSIIGEEGGFIAIIAVLSLFALLFSRGVKIAIRSPDYFGRYLALGITCILTLQALINMAVVMGVFPVTGIPLTFISFGGTSLVSSMFITGVLLNISSYKTNETQSEPITEDVGIYDQY